MNIGYMGQSKHSAAVAVKTRFCNNSLQICYNGQMMRLLLKIHNRLPKPVRKGLFQALSLSRRAMTLGVRIFATNAQGQVLLVRHTYISGWHLPGGCVERGETSQETAKKELFEETGLNPTSPMILLHIYKNPSHSRYDHVALFKCMVEPSGHVFLPNEEIAEIGFFNPTQLPDDTTPSTKNRVLEVTKENFENEIW